MLTPNLSIEFSQLDFDRPWTLSQAPESVDLRQRVTFDEQLLREVGESVRGPCLVIDCFPPSLVATVRESRMPGFSEAARELESSGWPVVVRCTGGSCVPQGPGVLNLSIIHPKVKGWWLEDGYKLLCRVLSLLLESYGLAPEVGDVPGSFCDGRYNLQVGGRKLVGTAQRWAGGSREKAAVLSHACLLVDLDLVVATERVNQLYRRCGQARQFRPEACVTLRDCLADVDLDSAEVLTACVAERLMSLVTDYFKTG